MTTPYLNTSLARVSRYVDLHELWSKPSDVSRHGPELAGGISMNYRNLDD
jgi:hypothetical protein